MKLLWAFMLLCGVQAVSSECDCSPFPGHPQTQYCTSDIVFIGKVRKILKPGSEDGNIQYRMKVLKSIKGSLTGKIIVTSVNSEDDCGITDLKRKKRYLLTAMDNDDGTYSIHNCTSLVKQRSKITKKLVRMYNSDKINSYPGRDQVNCNTCKIQYCGLNGNCGFVPPPPTTCTYHGDLAEILCYEKLRCVPFGDKCVWSSSKCSKGQ